MKLALKFVIISIIAFIVIIYVGMYVIFPLLPVKDISEFSTPEIIDLYSKISFGLFVFMKGFFSLVLALILVVIAGLMAYTFILLIATIVGFLIEKIPLVFRQGIRKTANNVKENIVWGVNYIWIRIHNTKILISDLWYVLKSSDLIWTIIFAVGLSALAIYAGYDYYMNPAHFNDAYLYDKESIAGIIILAIVGLFLLIGCFCYIVSEVMSRMEMRRGYVEYAEQQPLVVVVEDHPKSYIKRYGEVGKLGAPIQVLEEEYDKCLREIEILRAQDLPESVKAKVVVMTDGTPYCFVGIYPDDMCKKENLKISELWKSCSIFNKKCYTLGKFSDTSFRHCSVCWNRRGYGKQKSNGNQIPAATIDVIFKGSVGESGLPAKQNVISVQSHPNVLKEAYDIALGLCK